MKKPLPTDYPLIESQCWLDNGCSRNSFDLNDVRIEWILPLEFCNPADGGGDCAPCELLQQAIDGGDLDEAMSKQITGPGDLLEYDGWLIHFSYAIRDYTHTKFDPEQGTAGGYSSSSFGHCRTGWVYGEDYGDAMNKLAAMVAKWIAVDVSKYTTATN